MKDDDIFVEKKRGIKRKEKATLRKPKGAVSLIPTGRSEIKTAMFPETVTFREIAEKMRSVQFVPPEYDFIKVGETEGMLWYLGVACNASDAYSGDIVIPEAYAKMWVALQMQKEDEGYYLIILSEDDALHSAIGRKDVLLYHLYKRNIRNYTIDAFKKSIVDSIIQEFKLTTFPAVEIQKTIVIGEVPVSYYPALPNPVVISPNPLFYSGKLNLNPKKHYKDKFTWNKLISSLPAAGRRVVAAGTVFLLALSWAFPINAGISYINKLYIDNNEKIMENILQIRKSRDQLLKVIEELKKEENLVETWDKAAKSIKPIDYVKFSHLITSQEGVESFGMDKDKVVITLRVSSPNIIDTYIKRLIDSGYFKSFEAPERRAGTNTYILRGELK